MDATELARSTIEVLSEHLINDGTGESGSGEDAIASLRRLVVEQLGHTEIGARALERFLDVPDSPRIQREAQAAVEAEAMRNPAFQVALAEALTRFGEPTKETVSPSVTGDSNIVLGGRFTNRNSIFTVGDAAVDQSRRSLNLGTGGIAAIIIGALVILGGGTAVIYSSSDPFGELAGRWDLTSEEDVIGGLTIDGSGAFDLNIQGFGVGVRCTGSITEAEDTSAGDGNVYRFTTESGACPTIGGQLRDENTLGMEWDDAFEDDVGVFERR